VGNWNDSSTDHSIVALFSDSVPALRTVGSRKMQGGSPLDIDLRATPTAVESRLPGGTGTDGVDYKIVFTFMNDVTDCGSSDIGSLSLGPASNQCTVDMTNVVNQQYITMTLNNIVDSETNTGSASAQLGILVGDVDGNGRVDGNDVSAVQNHTRQSVDSTNCRYDVDLSGRIDGNDVSTTQAKTRTGLP
jgi:hypothetical protein